MFRLLLITLAIVGVGMLMLGIKVFFSKNGKFPNTHVSGNKYLREKKIYCVQTQDRQERNKNR